jgi:RNA polymerase sigma factor (sigma-70 family)
MYDKHTAVTFQPLSAEAFSALVERYQQPLHAFLRGLVENGEQARDLTQDTFAAAWRATQACIAPFIVETAEEEQRRWLYRTAYRRAVDLLRRKRLVRWEALDPIAEMETDNLPSFEDRVIEGEALRAALAELPSSDVACLLLRVVHGFSAAEVGEIMGASAEVITKRLSRARKRLRAAYLAQNPSSSQERNPC